MFFNWIIIIINQLISETSRFNKKNFQEFSTFPSHFKYFKSFFFQKKFLSTLARYLEATSILFVYGFTFNGWTKITFLLRRSDEPKSWIERFYSEKFPWVSDETRESKSFVRRDVIRKHRRFMPSLLTLQLRTKSADNLFHCAMFSSFYCRKLTHTRHPFGSQKVKRPTLRLQFNYLAIQVD